MEAAGAAAQLVPDKKTVKQLLWPLPYSLVLACFARLPADERLRLRRVCRAWRKALCDAVLWQTLDLV